MHEDNPRIRSGWSMRWKLGLLVLALLTVSAALAVGIGYGHVRAEGTAQIERELETAAREQARIVELQVRDAREFLRGVAGDRVVFSTIQGLRRGTLDVPSARRALWSPLSRALKQQPRLLGLAVADDTGMLVGATNTDWISRGAETIEGEPIPGRYTAWVRVPVDADAAPEARARVHALLDLDGVLRGASTSVGYEREPFLEAPTADTGDGAWRELAQRAARGGTGLEHVVDAQGERALAAYAPIPSLQWGLVLHARETDAFRALDRLRIGTLSILAAVLTAGVLASILLAQHFAQPIRELARAANRVSRGDLSVRVVTDRRDELGELAAAFNRMTNELERSYSTLERRVRERTVELEKVNAELASFSYAMAHDVRAPLRAIAGIGELLRAKKGPQLDAEARELLERIRYNTERLFRLIEDLLAFSGVANQELRVEEVELARIVRDAIDDFAEETRGRRVEFEVRVLPACRADAALLSLVFSNLISNAIKFTRPRELARIVVGGEVRDGEAVFFVRDNGVGFDSERAGRLFNLFQSLHSREEFDGTGLGLAIARRVVERHGGRIWAEARPGQGACFWFSLPVAAATHDPRAESRGVSAA